MTSPVSSDPVELAATSPALPSTVATALIWSTVTSPSNRLTLLNVEVLTILAVVSVPSVRIVLVVLPIRSRPPFGPALKPLTVF